MGLRSSERAASTSFGMQLAKPEVKTALDEGRSSYNPTGLYLSYSGLMPRSIRSLKAYVFAGRR